MSVDKFIFPLIAFLTLGGTFAHVTVPSKYFCSEAKDCPMKDALCQEGICQCPSGFILSATGTKCLKIATGYNDICEESVQCSKFLLTGGTCENGHCACLRGFHYLHGYCYRTKGLNETCSFDEECNGFPDPVSARCVKNQCQCQEGFYAINDNYCRRRQKLGEKCWVDEDCGKDYKCNESDKKCSDKTINSTSQPAPVTPPAKDQKAKPNTVKVGPACKSDADCKSIKNSQCGLDKVCICKKTFYALSDVQQCLPEIGAACESDADCKSIKNSQCGLDKVCICKRAFYASSDAQRCVPEIGESCSSKPDESRVLNSLCVDNTWICPIDQVPSRSKQSCDKAVQKFGNLCKTTEQCHLLGSNTECIGHKCSCSKGSHLINKKYCHLSRSLGETCVTKDECVVPGGHIVPECEGRCKCPKGSHISEDGDFCIDDNFKLGHYCVKDEHCAGKNDSVCEKNKCVCKKNFFEFNGNCLRGLSADCSKDNECKLVNSVCQNNNCQCADNCIPAKNNLACLMKKKINQECSKDEQCNAQTDHSHCHREEKAKTGICKCLESFYYKNGRCFKIKKLGEKCKLRSECVTKTEAAVCMNGVCRCDFNARQVGEDCRPK
ncbi:hypothetical protein TKK_0011001 [Trichogramma kaykai]